jgi:3-oxoacyl-[acyl-carrier protein] reductase
MRRALVTGGSGAIGSAICAALARRGMHVVVHGHASPERAAQTAEAIRAAGGSAERVLFDVCDAAATAQALERILEAGPVQVLVHNAGITADAPMAGMSDVARPLLLPMLRTRWGRIVAITSVAGILGNRGQSNYAAAKAGLHGAVKSLAIELASRGVAVNAVAPGIIASEMSRQAFSEEAIARLVPMGRAGTPEEVASVVAFLCSDEASYVSGQIVGVSGGMA